jgi:hypothetical protein
MAHDCMHARVLGCDAAATPVWDYVILGLVALVAVKRQ